MFDASKTKTTNEKEKRKTRRITHGNVGEKEIASDVREDKSVQPKNRMRPWPDIMGWDEGSVLRSKVITY